ncbi:hypothetical protein ONE63_000970 [Megalurothrips usitatus]|uniref:RNA-binding region-containing protein 3 n=1 Tax=Megalurothrips usitatus TaxID=439358 RepID=A0AAV7Y2P6_9NEOP|nr:hypothetical protein ONE63_000970 [Megalurothrips usitatus]
MSPTKGESSHTLLIRHLPREFSDIDKQEFLEHFGALTIKTICSGGSKNEVVFATFPSPAATKAALLQLHQMEILGRHLVVEYAQSSSFTLPDPGMALSEKSENRPEEDKRQRLQEQFMQRLVSWSSNMNLSQPPPSHLRYQYPPPTPATLSNISKALTLYPRLYTQLLHLMNRMNLPPPFQDGYLKPTCDGATQTDIVWVQKSSSESEMESEEETVSVATDSLSIKRICAHRVAKPIKRPRFIKPALPVEPSSVSTVVMKPEEVFEKTETEVHPKKIELRLAGSLSLEKEGGDAAVGETGGFGTLHPPVKPLEMEAPITDHESSTDDVDSVISAKELSSNRLSHKDLQVLPVFKNYAAGAPSCRLYVKNISKHVVARDLHFIYRRFMKSFIDETDDTRTNMFDVRLMTEGRMKGQAFITFSNVKQAEQALSETNGYILKDKPLVVQFARSAAGQ